MKGKDRKVKNLDPPLFVPQDNDFPRPLREEKMVGEKEQVKIKDKVHVMHTRRPCHL